jgi:hypothetical protein
MNRGDEDRRSRGRLAAVVLAALILPTAAVAVQQDVPVAAEAKAGKEDPTLLLCRQIRTAIAEIRPDASVEDFEAAIIYAISQSAAEDKVVDDALVCAAGGATGNAATAIANVQASRRKPRGTGAITGGGVGGVSLFSAPAVGIGGGGSNYTRN